MVHGLIDEDNTFLNQARQTKLEKRTKKHDGFLNKLSKSKGISKSSSRRIKRKEKKELHGGNMNNLLNALEDTEIIPEKDISLPGKKIITKEAKGPPSRKRYEKLVQNEITRFNSVLAEKSFQSSPFETLKKHITKNIKSVKSE